MKKLLKILGIIVAIVFLMAISGMSYLQTAFPNVSPAEDLQIEATPAMLERGRYLTENVALCLDCHSLRDYSYFPPKIIEGSIGGGGEPVHGAPGDIYKSNITPAALNDWSDGEIARAISSGVDKDGRPLVPMMPYSEYRHMAVEDVQAIVAYIRTLAPVENEIAEPSIDFPLNFVFRTLPTDAKPAARPDASDVVGTGKYLARIGGCFFCHSQVEQGVPIPGLEFAGNHEFDMGKGGIVRSANLTPDKETGIGNWSKEFFISRFKMYADSSYEYRKIKPGVDMQTVMPWNLQAGISEADLGAIYEYLHTLKPVRNSVVKFTAAK